MKKLALALVLAAAAASASAMTFWSGGILMGTVCRSYDNMYYTDYATINQSAPVGTSCTVRNIYNGSIIGAGRVTAE